MKRILEKKVEDNAMHKYNKLLLNLLTNKGSQVGL